MFDAASLALFVTATLALLLAPGPAVLYIVARSLEQGRMAGFISTLGVGLGSLVHVLFAAFGLSALLMQSVLAFSFIKYLGAAYLIYLGIKTLSRKAEVSKVQPLKVMSYGQIFRQGIVVNILNPKTALFFLAFLPQFVNPARGSVILQILTLGMIFVIMAIMSDSMYAVIAGTARQLLSGNILAARVQKYLAGTIYIALGITTAFSGSYKSK
ncbi:MAG: LysE family translocator [Trueperaceae bacterium]|nr:LysE family translocator [Trueperaceae bacterium]